MKQVKFSMMAKNKLKMNPQDLLDGVVNRIKEDIFHND